MDDGTQRKSWIAYQSVSFPIIVSDLDRRDAMGQYIQADVLNNARYDRTVRLIKFGRITCWGGAFLGVSHLRATPQKGANGRSSLRVRGPLLLNFWGSSL